MLGVQNELLDICIFSVIAKGTFLKIALPGGWIQVGRGIEHLTMLKMGLQFWDVFMEKSTKLPQHPCPGCIWSLKKHICSTFQHYKAKKFSTRSCGTDIVWAECCRGRTNWGNLATADLLVLRWLGKDIGCTATTGQKIPFPFLPFVPYCQSIRLIFSSLFIPIDF